MTKESLYSGPIFKDYLLNPQFLESEKGQFLINEHMLKGWLINKDALKESTLNASYKTEFKRQWHLNQSYLNEIELMAKDFSAIGLSPILLKGITFLGEIYEDLGDRSMSDVDILVSKDDLVKTTDILLKHGFVISSDKKWRANQHKVELIKNANGLEMVIELHTSLFYHSEDPDWSFDSFQITPYLKLSNEDLILYQCSHLAFQHTFLKLFWMIDIHLLITNIDGLDESKVLKMAKDHSLENSTLLTLFILDKYFETPMGVVFKEAINSIPNWKKKLLSIAFLMNPKENYFRYLSVKHLCRDNIKESLLYGFGWFKDRLS